MGVFGDHDSVMTALARMKGIEVGRARAEFEGKPLDPQAVVEALHDFVTEERKLRIESVLSARTRTVVPVVEGVVNMGNVSAVMRTAEALGYQDLHIVTGSTQFKDSRRTSIGAEKWLDVYHWTDAAECAAALKSAGYRIVATHLDATARDVSELDFTEPTAIVLGNEKEGVSPEMLELSDERCILPMTGFVQSYNISVAASIALYHAYGDRIERRGEHGDLTPDERLELRAAFYLLSVRGGDAILRRYLEEQPG